MCTPGGEDGNYIMFARATSGDKKNNNKFSPCSLRAIEPVLNSKARSSKGCFTGKIHVVKFTHFKINNYKSVKAQLNNSWERSHSFLQLCVHKAACVRISTAIVRLYISTWVATCSFQTRNFPFKQSLSKPFVAMVLSIPVKNVIVDGRRIVRTLVAIQCQQIQALMKNHVH